MRLRIASAKYLSFSIKKKKKITPGNSTNRSNSAPGSGTASNNYRALKLVEKSSESSRIEYLSGFFSSRDIICNRPDSRHVHTHTREMEFQFHFHSRVIRIGTTSKIFGGITSKRCATLYTTKLLSNFSDAS